MAPTPEHACPILRRVRRSAKKSFHVSWVCADEAGLAAGCEGDDDALRMATLAGKAIRGLYSGACAGCGSLVGRVHVEKDAPVAAHGARMAGGKRLANARAGHRALLVSIVTRGAVVWWWEWAWWELAACCLRTFRAGELPWVLAKVWRSRGIAQLSTTWLGSRELVSWRFRLEEGPGTCCIGFWSCTIPSSGILTAVYHRRHQSIVLLTDIIEPQPKCILRQWSNCRKQTFVYVTLEGTNFYTIYWSFSREVVNIRLILVTLMNFYEFPATKQEVHIPINICHPTQPLEKPLKRGEI
jgi:hypothetical protein